MCVREGPPPAKTGQLRALRGRGSPGVVVSSEHKARPQTYVDVDHRMAVQVAIDGREGHFPSTWLTLADMRRRARRLYVGGEYGACPVFPGQASTYAHNRRGYLVHTSIEATIQVTMLSAKPQLLPAK